MSAHGSIEIFRRGCHIDMASRPFCFSDADLERAATAYLPEISLAPLVIGHPTDNLPAYGGVDRLEYRDGSLWAYPVAVDPGFSSAVNAGRYRKVSASFYSPGSPDNPVPGVFYLRHVGFLGAMPPAVKGMQDPRFQECDGLDLSGWRPFEFVVPDGCQVDPDKLELHYRAMAFQEGRGVDYRSAVVSVADSQR